MDALERARFFILMKMPEFLKQHGLFRFLGFIFGRTIVLYLLLIFILAAIVNPTRIALNFLNQVKDCAEYVYQFAHHQAGYDPDMLRKGAAYYDTLAHFVPSPALAYGNLGFAYYYLGRPDLALKAYRKAIELEPGVYTFYYDVGMIYLADKNFSAAESFLLKGLELIPQRPEDFLPLLKTHTEYVKDMVAMDVKHLLSRANFDRAQTYIELDIIYFHLQNYPRMKAVALEGITYYPAEAELYYDVGLAHFAMGEHKEAVYYFSMALELAPTHAEALHYRAQSMRALGEHRLYLIDSRRAAELKGNSWVRARADIKDLHVYHDSEPFFRAYSLSNEW